jgi:UDP-2,3-diacylglucosamine hydrolase
MSYLRDKAIFIADAHYPNHGKELISLLDDIKTAKIKTTQLILMGDIFDLLFGYNDYIKKYSQNLIDLLNELSQDIEIIYLEGNHDFCLKSIFANIKVITRDMQPIIMQYQNMRIALSHGDLYDVGFGYELYCKWLRNKITLTMLKPWQKSIIDGRMHKLSDKNICHDFTGFNSKVKNISKHYTDIDIIIEGHFHQAKQIGNYISLPSLVCQKQYGLFEDGKVVFKRYDIS